MKMNNTRKNFSNQVNSIEKFLI